MNASYDGRRRFSAGLLLLCLTLPASVAWADCYYNGRSYPENTRINDFVCVKGQWVRA